jgi:glycosyltransferase involved in cell wall biosynthesis
LMRPSISVVVPVYRSQETLRELHFRLVAVLEPIDPSFELILVEDCGGDGSWGVIEAIAREDARVRGIQLSRNFGQHAATICGFAHARGQWIVTVDDDLEQAPEHLPALYRKALDGHDLVYGVYPGRSHKAWRNITSNVARWLFNKAIPSLNYTYTSFRVIRGDIARALMQSGLSGVLAREDSGSQHEIQGAFRIDPVELSRCAVLLGIDSGAGMSRGELGRRRNRFSGSRG